MEMEDVEFLQIYKKLLLILLTTRTDTVLAKLNHYGIRGVSNEWFKSSLSNRNQYVSINGFDSGYIKLWCP